MFRSVLSDGRLSDMANLTWTKNALLAAAQRELDWERRATDPRKTQQKRGVFSAAAAPIEKTDGGLCPVARGRI
jgi:hypothetical protein